MELSHEQAVPLLGVHLPLTLSALREAMEQ